MSDFLLPQKKIDRHHALASQQRSVETRNKARARGKHQPNAGTICHPGQKLGDSRGRRRQLPERPWPALIVYGNVVGNVLGMGKQRFDQHGNTISPGGKDAKEKPSAETRSPKPE